MRLTLGLVLACSALACDATPGERAAEPQPAATAQAATAAPLPQLVLLATAPGSTESSLLRTRPGSPLAPQVVARLPHAPDGEARGALLPGGERAVVVADMERRRDPSFGAWLFSMGSGGEPRVLAEGCVHATRPWVLPSGRVLVQRGTPGPELDPAASPSGALRTDALRIDEIDPEGAPIRTVHAFSGYITHIAGVLDGEVFVYRVSQQGADLIAVGIDSGSVRVLAQPIVAQARDFSVDVASRSLVYANLAASGWGVERVSIDSAKRESIASADGMGVTPSVWPTGGVLVNDGRGAVTLGGRGPRRPLGAGFDEVSAVSAGGKYVALTHRTPGDFAQVFVTDAEGAHATPVPAAPGHRLSVVGFLP